MKGIRSGLLAAALAISSGASHAAVTISNAPSRNMICAAGKCTPTAPDAVLDANDLETLLASGDVSVVTSAHGVQASDIRMTARLKWSSGASLSLLADRSVFVAAVVTILHRGGLAIATDRGGKGGGLAFGSRGRIDFRDVSSKFAFNGQDYALAADIATLALLVAARPSGLFALASDDNLTNGYSGSPIPTDFGGTLEGLGHTIANLDISTTDTFTGLFSTLDVHSIVRNLKLSNLTIVSENSDFSYAGAVAGYSQGTVAYVQASGTIESNFWLFGGGIVGLSYGPILRSFANVNVSGGDNSELGGLAGNIHGKVEDCYALGPANGGDESFEGGLIGNSLANVTASYSTGAVLGGQNALIGGFTGNLLDGRISKSYWDTTTSGSDRGTGQGNVSGLKGPTTEQLQSGLPRGFNPDIWAQNPGINGGLPYLIDNPPPE